MDDQSIEPGGFIYPALPSPSPSNASQSSTAWSLPHPRSHPLRAGSAKEEAARRYIESRLLHISRRYTKKFQPPDVGESVTGYQSMVDVSKDLSEVMDVLWLSGTPSLQVPYMLNVALSLSSYLPAFPPAPVATFGLLKKLDHAFASLLKGEDILTAEVLPGFEGGRGAGMSKTDMVRCKSLVESTRVLAVEVMSKEPGTETEDGDDTGMESGTEADSVSFDLHSGWDGEEDLYDMDVARVYERTIVQLNELLASSTSYGDGDGVWQ